MSDLVALIAIEIRLVLLVLTLYLFITILQRYNETNIQTLIWLLIVQIFSTATISLEIYLCIYEFETFLTSGSEITSMMGIASAICFIMFIDLYENISYSPRRVAVSGFFAGA